MTIASAKALAGQGLMGVARDNYPQDGQIFSFVASFAEVEVDVETGSYKILDFLAVADVGTVIHPKALGGQIMGRSMLGIAPRHRSEVGVTTSIWERRWPSVSTTTNLRRFWMRRSTWNGRR